MSKNSSDTAVVDSSDPHALHAIAVAIADHAARSEIELYAVQATDIFGRRVFNTALAPEESVDEQGISLVAKAARYIELRGAALPYRLERAGTFVWFEELDSAKSVTHAMSA